MISSLLVSAPTLFACASPKASPLASPVQAQAQSTTVDSRPGIAVFPFENGGSYGDDKEDFARLGLGIQRSLMAELASNTGLRIVDRASLRELLQEQDLGASGRVTPETAARIGRVVGARYVITGGFIDMMGDFQLTGSIVDTETSEVIKAAQANGKPKNLYRLIVDVAAQVTKNVNLPELPKEVREAQKKRDVPVEAMTRYAMITSLEDEGQKDRAIALYKDLVKDFPQMENWKQELRQLSGG